MNNWSIPEEMELKIKERDKKCVYCGVPLEENIKKGEPRGKQGTWEHIINDVKIISYENIARCCSSCNSSKGTKKLSLWILILLIVRIKI